MIRIFRIFVMTTLAVCGFAVAGCGTTGHSYVTVASAQQAGIEVTLSGNLQGSHVIVVVPGTGHIWWGGKRSERAQVFGLWREFPSDRVLAEGKDKLFIPLWTIEMVRQRRDAYSGLVTSVRQYESPIHASYSTQQVGEIWAWLPGFNTPSPDSDHKMRSLDKYGDPSWATVFVDRELRERLEKGPDPHPEGFTRVWDVSEIQTVPVFDERFILGYRIPFAILNGEVRLLGDVPADITATAVWPNPKASK